MNKRKKKPANSNFCAPMCKKCCSYQPIRNIPMVFLVPVMVILTMLFFSWSCYSFYLNLEVGYVSSILSGVIFFAIGSFFGRKESQTWRVSKQCCKELVTMPRTQAGIIVIIISFILKFFWGYFYANCTDIPCWMYLLDTILSSLVIGFFLSQLVIFFHRYLRRG
jgi:hypothetical protein